MIGPPRSRGPATVLVVDDDLANRRLLEVMLGPEGYVVEQAAGGAEALSSVARRRPDLILLDAMMPGVDGYQVAAALKANPATRNVPIIMVTVRDDREAKMRGLRAGAEDFLSKPVDRAELCARVKNLLRLKAHGDEQDHYSRLLEEEVASRTAHLLESEARYRRIVETSNEGVWAIDAGGRTSFMNTRMAQMLGCNVEQAVALAPTEFLSGNGLEALTAGVRESEPGGSSQIEVQLTRRDGGIVWALLERSAIYDAGGAFEGTLAMVMDVSARRAAEEAQRASEFRFRRLWDSGLFLITICGPDGKITDVNEAGAQMLGYSREQLLAGELSWNDLTPSEASFGDIAARARLGADGLAAPFEQEALRRDGSRLPILIGKAMLGPGEAMSVALDLTARKRAERASFERMRMAELSANVGAALTAGGPLEDVLQRCVDLIVEHADAAAAEIWTFDARQKALVLKASAGGVHRPRVTASPPPEVLLVSDERRPRSTNDLQSDSRTAGAGARADELVAFAGHPLLVSGELVGVIAIYARRGLDETTLNGLGTLAHAIAIGVHRSNGDAVRVELEGQLRQAQKMEAVGRLAGGVGHDFNNVLSVILSYAELMFESLQAGDPMRGDLEEIQKAANRAADLTRQLMMFSRQQILEPKVLDLNEILERMDKMLKRILGEDIQLVLDSSPALGHVRADPTTIEQIVMNLVVNARDAMPTGGTLTIGTANVDLDEEFVRLNVGAKVGRHILLCVKDTGTGMDLATQSRIFEPFFTTKPLEKGTGLGLSTVFGIAQQSGGGVRVESELGKGTLFEVYLPRVDGDPEKPRVVVTAPVRRGTETILLVDDDEQVRQVALGILRRHGYTVIEARHAGEALLYCEQHAGGIDLLLTDVVMPQLSGPSLARRLVKDRPAMRVLCMSGYTDDSVIRHGVEANEIAFLQKPITPDSLTRKVREVLDA